MANALYIITVLIIITGLFNVFRLTVFMIAAEVYDLKMFFRKDNVEERILPTFTVLIPAYNEEACIRKTILSVINADYPAKEIVVVNDGSTDNTARIVNRVILRHWRINIRLINQTNSGKGAALNNGIRNSTGELVMVIDADSTIATDSLKNSVKYFDDKKTRAIAASVRLEKNGTLLGLIQRVEYLLAYRMKRSLTTLNIEYIIGGVGSVYRRSTLKQVGGYRSNTITEDIDLSMKVVARGNKAYRIKFASDVRTSTQPVLTVNELIKQRYRWKQGRMQAFVRYRYMFVSGNSKYAKMLSWFQLPYSLLGEAYLIVEPIFIATIIAVAIIYSNLDSVIAAMSVMSIFMILNFMCTNDESKKEKSLLIIMAPFLYLMLPLLSYVELVSLFKTIKNWRKLSPNIKSTGHWVHVQRSASAT